MDAHKPLGIAYLESLAPWSGSFSAEWSLNLMRELMGRLDNPQDRYPTIHVAGTNGKGSVSVAIASILAEGGRKVGLTTSPHLKRINERVVIDGRPVSDELLDRCGELVRDAARWLKEPPTFFEGITAAAFLAFKEAGVDLGVVEVGLGGRLDATNVLEAPKVSVVVTIDFDHEQILGSTLGAIAREKAGIIKRGVPVVVGGLGEEACSEVSRVARLSQSKLVSLGTDFHLAGLKDRSVTYADPLGEFTFNPALRGDHQIHNMGVAIAAARLVGASVEECRRGVENVTWPGRLEIVRFREREIIIDAAHNPAGIESLVSFLKSREERPQCAFGAINTKNWREMVLQLAPVVSDWTILEPDFPKALASKEIVAFLSGSGINARSLGRDYHRFVDDLARGRGPVLIAGSIYLIGIIRDLLVSEEPSLWRAVGR